MRRKDEDFSEEIRAHLQHEVDDLVARGMSPEEARHAARRRFGNVTVAEEHFRESRGWVWLDRSRQDLRDAARSVTRFPVAALVGILSIAAGIGATTTTLTIRNVVFHNPPPEYGDPEQLSAVRVARGTRPIVPIGSYAPGGLVAAWTAALGPSVIGAARPPQGVRDVRSDNRLEPVDVRAVTPELFDVLGVRPALGRTLSAASGDAAPAMLSYRIWQLWFDGRPDAVGNVIWIENRPHTIVGVLPPRFWFSEMQSAVWTAIDPRALDAEESLEVIVRRPHGVTHEALFNQLQPLMADYASRQPADRRELHMQVSRVEGTPMGAQMSIALPWVLGTASLLTLLIACANVAILMIAQWTSREHEISIRASLGASRGRLMRTLLTESVAIASVGGALGIATTFALRALMLRNTGFVAAFFDLSIHPSVLVQSAAITLAAGILTGMAPAVFETRRLHGNPMRVNALTESLRQRWRHALVVLEIGVTVALLVVAGAFINGYRRTATANLGFDTRPMLSARVSNAKGVPLQAVLDALHTLPGVESAAASTTVPFTASGLRTQVAGDAAGTNAIRAEHAAITPEFFDTLDVPLRSGRPFSGRDAPNARIAIVNEALARRLFAGADAVGRSVWMDGAAYDIVGVAANYANQPFFREHEPRIFRPMEMTTAPQRATFAIRAKDDPAPLVQAVRRVVRDAAPGNVVGGAFTFETIKAISGQEILVGTAPLFPLILIGMLLTTAGIYGVLAFAIARRSRELAVRVAIGATGRDLVRLVARHTGRLVALGAFLGVGLTFALTRVVRASGGAGSPFDADWTAFAVPVALIALIAALATWVPARRVKRIDPAVLLRSEI